MASFAIDEIDEFVQAVLAQVLKGSDLKGITRISQALPV